MSDRSSGISPTPTLPPSSFAEELVEYESDLDATESLLGWDDDTGWSSPTEVEEPIPPTQRSPAGRLHVTERPVSVTMVAPAWDAEPATERTVKVA